MSHFRSRTRTAALLTLSAIGLTACGAGGGDGAAGPQTGDDGVTTIAIGASPTPHTRILEFIDKELAPEAELDLEITTIADYVQPNVQLQEGTLDANYFQHEPYLEEQISDRGYDFAHYRGIHIEPYALYSDTVEDVGDLPQGAQIGVSNDPANQGRALELLQSADLITLEDGKDATNATLNDIADNPKELEFTATDPAQLVRALEDLDGAVINGNYALEADLVPTQDGLLVEDGEDNPYANFIAVRSEDKDDPALQKLNELARSPEVEAYIEETWPKGGVLPAF
ncbi:MetQ/NlpA family ABC transporter substrate-binding protein [Janibacter cremeus]|uniref:MetQ/NlpA family ABC transporter substrate-binding protein n=1 Tax=Janibacter cremeus TaxID=1285192 RepID=UPI0023F7B311|nr:MetQ/NlpA family ABC transporter substrate-binding protein [Janibacter cremeus]WEV79261.1 MetQ/NlpA family ABC transporter substrate-binding protein [Janibacter cremeus]